MPGSAGDSSASSPKGRCDICERFTKNNRSNGPHLMECRVCHVQVHDECYGYPPELYQAERENFICHACKAVGTTVQAKTKKGKEKYVRVTERPQKCVLCTVDYGIHAMHPIYNHNYKKDGKHLVMKNGELAWAHTLCALFMGGTRGTARSTVYGCYANGRYEGSDSEDDSDESDDDEGLGTTHHFVICSEEDKGYWENMREHQQLKCFLCGSSDQFSRRIPIQCSAGDSQRSNEDNPQAYPLDVDIFGREILGVEPCTQAMHVGCARWRNPLAIDRRLFFYPGTHDQGEYHTNAVAEAFCTHHCSLVKANRERRAKSFKKSAKQSTENRAMDRAPFEGGSRAAQSRLPRAGQPTVANLMGSSRRASKRLSHAELEGKMTTQSKRGTVAKRNSQTKASRTVSLGNNDALAPQRGNNFSSRKQSPVPPPMDEVVHLGGARKSRVLQDNSARARIRDTDTASEFKKKKRMAALESQSSISSTTSWKSGSVIGAPIPKIPRRSSKTVEDQNDSAKDESAQHNVSTGNNGVHLQDLNEDEESVPSRYRQPRRRQQISEEKVDNEPRFHDEELFDQICEDVEAVIALGKQKGCLDIRRLVLARSTYWKRETGLYNTDFKVLWSQILEHYADRIKPLEPQEPLANLQVAVEVDSDDDSSADDEATRGTDNKWSYLWGEDGKLFDFGEWDKSRVQLRKEL